MIKPDSLRKAITAAVPSLAKDPDKLLVFADEGQIVATNTASLSFDYRYTLNLILLDQRGSADQVMIALLQWVKVHQSDLLANQERRHNMTFEVDALSNTTYDLSIKLPLSESVKVTIGANGKPLAEHLAEPQPEWLQVGLAGG